MKIYLAGHASRPKPKDSLAQFLRASELLRGDYHEVFPTDEQVTEADRLDTAVSTGTPYDFRGDLSRSLAWICDHADAVLVLPSWRDTARGRAEVAAAGALHLPVWAFTEFILHGDKAQRLTA